MRGFREMLTGGLAPAPDADPPTGTGQDNNPKRRTVNAYSGRRSRSGKEKEKEMTQNDIKVCAYYDRLSEADRVQYREHCPWYDGADDPDAIELDLDRIDAGLKARCLS